MRILYQPIVDVRSRAVVKAEALCRLGTPTSPQKPDDFIPYAEANGLIRDLTDRLMAQALGDWKAMGQSAPPGLSLNLSVKNLEERDLADRVASSLRRAGLASTLLWFELNEDVQTIAERELATMKAVASLGVRFSVDSFGLGLSQVSFSELKRLPGIAELKIDARFVRDMDEDTTHRARVNAVLELARNMGLRVVAKGVERLEVARLLERIGCSFAQGFYYGEPCEASALRELVERPRPIEAG